MLDRAPDYFAELPENAAPYGRVIVSQGPGAARSTHWAASSSKTSPPPLWRSACGSRLASASPTSYATRVVRGVVTEGQCVRARRGVVFATGGFTHAEDLLRDYFTVPLRHGGASLGSEGDFVRIGQRLGPRLHNMNGAWLAPVPDRTTCRRSRARSRPTSSPFAATAWILVDRAGRRVANEKLPYNELASVFLRWDPTTAEFPNLRLFMVFDDATARLFADGKSGNPLPSPASTPRTSSRATRSPAR